MRMSNYGIMCFFGQAFPLLIPMLLSAAISDIRKAASIVESVVEETRQKMERKSKLIARGHELYTRMKDRNWLPLSPAERQELDHILEVLSDDISSSLSASHSADISSSKAFR